MRLYLVDSQPGGLLTAEVMNCAGLAIGCRAPNGRTASVDAQTGMTVGEWQSQGLDLIAEDEAY